MEFLNVQSIYKSSQNGFGLHNIQFAQQKFQHLAIVGETGSGKSTLLKIIAGLEQPDAGNVFFEGIRVQGPFEKLIPGHPGIAYLSQYFELPNFLRVEQVLAYANLLTDETASKLYALCDIEHLMKRRTDQLSGGEKQRIALARLLLTAPKLLLLDEPFSNFDAIHKQSLKRILEAVANEFDISIILIAHDPLDILSWADYMLVMQNGTIVQEQMPAYVYRYPINAYVAGLLGSFQLFPKSFSSFFSVEKKWHELDNQLFIRPDDFMLLNANVSSNEAVVQSIEYFGSYQVIAVLHIPTGTLVNIQTQARNIKIGDKGALEISSL